MSELNEKIVELLESDVFWETHEFSPPDFNLESAAKAIEILVLEREIATINEVIEKERMPGEGLCFSLPNRLVDSKAFELITPSEEEMDNNGDTGGGYYYWGNEDCTLYSNHDFTPQRQTLLLIAAALNGEFD